MSDNEQKIESIGDVSVRDILQYLAALQMLAESISKESNLLLPDAHDHVQDAMSNLYLKLKSNEALRKVVIQSSAEQMEELRNVIE